MLPSVEFPSVKKSQDLIDDIAHTQLHAKTAHINPTPNKRLTLTPISVQHIRCTLIGVNHHNAYEKQDGHKQLKYFSKRRMHVFRLPQQQKPL